jgi:predicted deacylase
MAAMSSELGPGRRLETLEASTRDGTPISVDVVRIGRGEPGPHLAIVAALHGTEYASVAAMGRLIQTLDASRLHGTLTLVPVANRHAFESRTMYVCPADGKNLNRTFPGDPSGSYAEVLADLLWRAVASRASHILDVHGGELVEGLVPFTGAYALDGQAVVADRSRQLAEAFDTPYIVRNTVPANASGGSRLAHVATRAGIAAALVEAGQRGRMDEADVRFITDGVLNAMRAIGMLDEPPLAPARSRIMLEEIEVYAHTSGLFHTRVVPGDAIEPGQQLGEVVDYLGRTVERFTSQWSGVVLGVIGPAMVAGRFPLVVGVRA